MKISSRQFIKEAVTKTAFVESLKIKYEADPDFIIKTQNKDGEEIFDINKDAVILINKFYGYKKLNSVNQASMDYSGLIDSLPSTWREAADLMSKEIAAMSADPTKAALISLGLKEEDIANKEIRAWLEDRYINNKGSEIHPISEALDTLKEYVALKDAILSKIKTDEDFKSNLEDIGFTEDKLKNILSLSVDNMVSILSKYKYGEKTTIRTYGVEIREGERVGKVGEWNIWLPQTQETSAKIAGYDDVTKDPKTTWCTGRTKGSNLFYHYISRGNIISFLFYIIRDNPKDVYDWLSMGFLGDTDYGLDSIKPVYSQDGGVTIDRDNRGLSEEDFRQILGKNYSTIFDMMRNKIAELGGKNPATKELENYAKNLSLFRKALWNKSKEEKKEFANIVLQMNPSDDVKGLALSVYYPRRIIENRSEPWAAPYLKDSIKRAAEEDPNTILEYGGEVWAKPYLNQAAKNAAKIGSYDFSEIITEKWIQPYLDGVAEIYLEENPLQIIRHRSEDWAVDYFDRAVEKVGNTNPKEVLYYSSLENEDGDEYDNWPAPYLEKSIKKLLEEEPLYILRYSGQPWAKPYLDLAAKKAIEENPRMFLSYYGISYYSSNPNDIFIRHPWIKPHHHNAMIRLIEKSPNNFFEGWSERPGDWIAPYFNYAIKEAIKEDPGSFIKNYSDEFWASKEHNRLFNGKSLIDLAKKFLKIEKENEQYDSYVKTEKIRKGSSLIQSKLDLLKSTLRSLGLHKEAFLISNAILERFEPAAWNICLKEVLRGNKNLTNEVKREMNNLNAEDRRKVFDIIGRFTNAEQTTILSSILNFEPEVKREFTWRDVIGVRPKKETQKVRNIDPSDFSDYALCFTKDVEATLNKTKLTGEILDRWVLEDFNNVRMDGHISPEESIESVLNEPDLQSKYILAMNLLKKTYDRDRVRLAEKLFLRVLRSRINVEKRSDDLGNLTTIN